MHTLVKLLLVGCLFSTAGCDEDVVFEKVTILGPDFEVVTVLESQAELEAFGKVWRGMVPSEEVPFSLAALDSIYKLDLRTSNGNIRGRWLYHPSGYIARLHKTLSPSYKVGNIESFNEAISI